MSGVFYHIYSATMDGCYLTAEANEEARRSWLCSGCNSPKPGVQAIDVQLSHVPGTEPLNSAVEWGVPIASRKFLDSIGSDVVEQQLYLGRVLGPDGNELEEWVTFRGKHRQIVRGSKEVSCRQCPDCGQTLYFAMDKSYLYPGPPEAVTLFESDMCGIVLSEDLFTRSGIQKQRGIWIDKLHVATTPKDSLGELN
jgi:hypothetical protein